MPVRATDRFIDRFIDRAAANPLVRGGLILGAGIVLGNLMGFARSLVTAYLLGTHAAADALAVAISPLDTLNTILINTMLFAFVPMLLAREGDERIALFRQACRFFTWMFCCLTMALIVFAPYLIRWLGPGLRPEYQPAAIGILRITSLSTLAAGASAIHSALLFTQRRFGPPAFYQASINVFTIAGALLLWRVLGIYGFAIGYACGAWAQFAFVYVSALPGWKGHSKFVSSVPWRELISKPGSFLIYAGLIALNVIVTRAYATHAGSGMAAAFDYSIRCVNVVFAYLVMPVSSTLLPEIARLRGEQRSGDAFRLIDRAISYAALAAVISCIIGVMLRQPVIAFLFQRGSFTAESTRLVSGAFLGFGPSLIGISLLELNSRALFAFDRPWLPICAAAIPVGFNLVFSAAMRAADPVRFSQPEYIGLGASLGLLLAFAALYALDHGGRQSWAEEFAGESSGKLVAAG